jgi:hypothetical protein
VGLAVDASAFRERNSGWLSSNRVNYRCCISVCFRSGLGAAAVPEHPDSGFKDSCQQRSGNTSWSSKRKRAPLPLLISTAPGIFGV